MTREEAFSVLGIDDADDAADAYESLLFEQRKFLLSSPVLLKTFRSRIAKAALLHSAYSSLGNHDPAFELPETAFVRNEVLSEHILAYHAEKNRLKQILAGNLSYAAIEAVGERLIALERSYAEPFSLFSELEAENVLVSREADVMELLESIREQEQRNVFTFGDFHAAKHNLPEILRKELKRLSLLPNYLYE